jgi:uncharacterized delta-60 repeat protein
MTIPRATSRRSASFLPSALVLATLLLATGIAFAAEGDLATATWPGTGFAAAPTIPGGGGSVGQAVAVQPDGKVVVAGYASVSGNLELVLVRYLTTGGLDTTFGTNGVVVDGTLTPGDIGYYVALQASGAIDVAGFQTQAGKNIAALVQYTPAGARDATFGLGGVAASPSSLPDLATSTDVVYNGVAVQGDGRIVCVGRYYDATNGRYTAMAVRYTATGAIDGTFGAGGDVEIRPTIVAVNGNVFGNHVVIEPDGHILGCGTAGQTTNNMMAFRLTANGFLDAGFGTNGVQTVQFAAGVASKGTFIDLQSDGKAVCMGSTGSPLRFAVARFTTTGQLDTNYGSGGMVTLPAFVSGSTAEECTAGAVQWDGKTALYGYSSSGSTSLVVARLTTTGVLDTTFGSGGSTVTGGANITNGAAITALTTSGVPGPNPNHQLVVTGQNSSGSLFAARYILDTTAPVTLITTPANNADTNNQTPPVVGTSEPYCSVTIFADGSIAGSATASATGTWSLPALATTLAAGAHAITASGLDAAGNQGALSTPMTITIDLVPPTIVSVTPAASPTAASPIVFNVTFSKPVGSFAANGLTLSNCSNAVTASTGNGTVWTITVVPTAMGVVSVTIPAGDAHDLAGNANTDNATGSAQYTGTGGVATTSSGTTGGGTSQAGFIDNGGSSHSKCGLGGGLIGMVLALAALRRRNRRAA